MTPEEQVQAFIFVGAFLAAFALGVRASWRLRKRYRASMPDVEQRNRPILFIIVVAAWIITVAAGWIGGLSAFRILTDIVLPFTPPITILITTAVVFIPVMFDVAITRLAEGENEPKINRIVRYFLELQTGHIPTAKEVVVEKQVEAEATMNGARPIVGVEVDVDVQTGKEINHQ